MDFEVLGGLLISMRNIFIFGGVFGSFWYFWILRRTFRFLQRTFWDLRGTFKDLWGPSEDFWGPRETFGVLQMVLRKLFESLRGLLVSFVGLLENFLFPQRTFMDHQLQKINSMVIIAEREKFSDPEFRIYGHNYR